MEIPCSKLQGISILKVRLLSYSLANPAASYGECAHSRIHLKTYDFSLRYVHYAAKFFKKVSICNV